MTVKQIYAAVLALCGTGCILAATILYAKNFSDFVHLRKNKARRTFQAGAFEAHPAINPVSKRASRMKLLYITGIACFMVAIAVAVDS